MKKSKKRTIYKFKDQPNGDCFKCKWNASANDSLDCSCPRTHMTNKICLAKVQCTLLHNLYLEFTERDNGYE